MDSGTRVVVTDIEMRFGSMVVFMLKWAIAVIPAALILAMLAFFGTVVLSAFVQVALP